MKYRITIIFFVFLSTLVHGNAQEPKIWKDQKGVTHIELEREKPPVKDKSSLTNQSKGGLNKKSLQDYAKDGSWLYWNSKEYKDSITDEIIRYIYWEERDGASETFYIIKNNKSNCIFAKLESKYTLLDFKRAPIMRVDDNKAISVDDMKTKKHTSKTYTWSIGDCNKEDENSFIDQLLSGNKLKIRYFEYPEGMTEKTIDLFEFKDAYGWLSGIPMEKLLLRTIKK